MNRYGVQFEDGKTALIESAKPLTPERVRDAAQKMFRKLVIADWDVEDFVRPNPLEKMHVDHSRKAQ